MADLLDVLPVADDHLSVDECVGGGLGDVAWIAGSDADEFQVACIFG